MSEAGSHYTANFSIRSDPVAARRVQKEIERRLKEQRYSEHEIFAIRLALEEALVNAIKHGNGLDRKKKVQINYRVLPDRFEIHITDEGPGFDPTSVPDCTTAENLERPCGRGLMLMRYYMNNVTFSATGNSVSMLKLRNGTK
jgi:serine/threonine-protein kinase RsbW